MSWNFKTVVVENNDDSLFKMINERDSHRTTDKSDIVSSRYSVVGMDTKKIPKMQEAIEKYAEVISKQVSSMDEYVKTEDAFKNEEVYRAVNTYLDAVKLYISNLASQLNAFSDKLSDVSKTWILFNGQTSDTMNQLSSSIDAVASGNFSTKSVTNDGFVKSSNSSTPTDVNFVDAMVLTNKDVREARKNNPVSYTKKTNDVSTLNNSQYDYASFNDRQKISLTKVAYVNLDFDALSKAASEGKEITISDLGNYLENGDGAYLGKAAESIAGITQTNQELIQELNDYGLGDLKVDYVYKNSVTGLNVIIFKDDEGNKYFSYRGTDVNTDHIGNVVLDSLTDASTYLFDNSMQVQQALYIYDKQMSKDGNNYLFGHSLGGGLSNYVYFNNQDSVTNVYSVNGLPLNPKTIGNSDAFRNEKYENIVFKGDFVSRFNGNVKEGNNYTLVDTNDASRNFIFAKHAAESGVFDSNGNLIRIDSDNSNAGLQKQLSVIDKIDSAGNVLKNGVSKVSDNIINPLIDKGLDIAKKHNVDDEVVKGVVKMLEVGSTEIKFGD